MSISKKQLDRIKKKFTKLDDKFDDLTDKCPKCREGLVEYIFCKKHEEYIKVLDDMEKLIDLFEDDRHRNIIPEKVMDMPGTGSDFFEVKLTQKDKW